MAELHFPLNFHIHGLLMILNGRLLIHDVRYALHTGDEVHQMSGQVAQLAHIAVEHPRIGDELQQLAGSHGPRQGRPAPEESHQIGAQPQQKGQHGKKHRKEGLVASLHPCAFVRGLKELPRLSGLLTVGLHHRHAGNHVLQSAYNLIVLQSLHMKPSVNLLPPCHG